MCWSAEEHRASSSTSPDLRLISLPAIARGITSDDRNRNVEAMNRLVSFLSDSEDPPVDTAARSGVVPRLVTLFYHSPDLKYEAAYILTLLTASENNDVLIQNATVPIFVHLLRSDREEDRALAIKALTNIVVLSPMHSAHVLDSGAVTNLLAQFSEFADHSVLVDTAMLLDRFCSFLQHPAVKEERIATIDVLRKLLCFVHCECILSCASSAIEKLSSPRDPEIISMLCDSRIVYQLVTLFWHSSTEIQTAALIAVNHIVRTDIEHMQVLIDNGLLSGILTLLRNTEDNVLKKFIFYVLYIIAAHSNGRLMIESGLVDHVIHYYLLRDDDSGIKRHAVWVVSRVTHRSDPDQIRSFVTQDCVEVLCRLLAHPDLEIVEAALLSLVYILDTGEREYKQKFVDAGGLLQISQFGGDDNISWLASEIMRTLIDYI